MHDSCINKVIKLIAAVICQINCPSKKQKIANFFSKLFAILAILCYSSLLMRDSCINKVIKHITAVICQINCLSKK